MPVDAQVKALLDQAAAAGRPPRTSQTVAEARAVMRGFFGLAEFVAAGDAAVREAATALRDALA
jgi:hypothetical protein